MWSYVGGTVFIVAYVLIMYIIGISATNNKKSYPYCFIIGYLIYSFFIAIGGIPIQILNLDWNIFFVYTIFVLILLFSFSLMQFKKNNIKIDIEEFACSQWFFILIAFFLVLMSVTNIEGLWLCNCLDDGYYISIAGGQQEAINGFFTNPSTGLPSDSIGSYIFNTIFTEYSVFVKLLNINVFVFCRVFMAFFNYFLYGTCISTLAEYIFDIGKKNIKYFQYFSVILLIFGLPPSILEKFKILIVQDSWQFNTAMFYGSSIIRTCGSLLLILPFLRKEKISIKDVLYVIGISIGLVSKSSIALPVIFVTSISYLITNYLFSKDKKKIIISIILVILIFVLGLIIGNFDSIQSLVYSQLKNNLFSIVFGISLVGFGLSLFFKKIEIYKINCFILLSYLFMLTGIINNVFEVTSVYSFVAARMLTMMIYLTFITSFIYICYGINLIVKENNYIIYLKNALIVCTIVSVFVVNFIMYGGLSSYSILTKNIYLVPQTTIMLGEVLENRYNETNQLNYVIMPEGVPANNKVHSVAIILRSVSPHSISLSATGRYGEANQGKFKGYRYDNQQIYVDFLNNPNENTYSKFSNVLNEYPINCFISTINNYENYLSKNGFYLYSKVNDSTNLMNYYIYVRDIS